MQKKNSAHILRNLQLRNYTTSIVTAAAASDDATLMLMKNAARVIG